MNIRHSVIAGFAATLVLSALMVLKSMMGLMPQLNVIAMLSEMMQGPLLLGWLAHFMIGAILFGIAFAKLYRFLPGKAAVVKGIAFGVAAWVVMMIAVMPMAGAGIFGARLGLMAPVMTLMLHVIYGAVLGAVSAKLAGSRATAAQIPAEAPRS